ncbi:MAG: transposase [candidate division Zixibacteria bacterium]|nr:transposase [candidate division Zixibacteria bacterium]
MRTLRHYDNIGTARFVTITCYKKLKLFQEPQLYELFCHHLESFRCDVNILLLTYVIMPNHVHLLLLPNEQIEIGREIGKLKGRYAHEVIQRWKDKNSPLLKQIEICNRGSQEYAFWLPRCYDYNCRTIDKTLEKINYCHNNPIKAGLVENTEDWPWSSYNWYQGDHSGIVTIDEFPM